MSSTCLASAALACLSAAALVGCGFSVQSPDDFLLTRTGQGAKLTMLVNDSGTIRCDGSAPKQISSSMLISARDLVDNLDKDAKARLNLPQASNSVYRYMIRMQDGTIHFPDTAAVAHHELAGAEQYALEALAGPCRAIK
jgi:hypothetical protein